MHHVWSNPLIFLTHSLFGIIHLESIFRLKRNQVCISRNWKLSQSKIWSKDAGLFLKISFFFSCFSHFFAIAVQLTGFSISRLANLEDVNINVNIKVSISDYLFKYICLVCYLKIYFYCLTCSAMPNLNSVDSITPNSHHRFQFSK